jgi:hypothetical protein
VAGAGAPAASSVATPPSSPIMAKADGTAPAASPATSAETRSATTAAARTISGDDLTNESATELWKQAVLKLEGLLARSASQAGRIVVADSGRLIIAFPADQGFCRDLCERPENRARLQEVLSELHGHPMGMEFEIDESLAPVDRQATTGSASPQQRRDEAASRPFVRRAMELFSVEASQFRYLPPESGA